MSGQRTTHSGRPPMDGDHPPAPDMSRLPNGQHRDHWVLSEAERAKGFVRPVRRSYVHTRCGSVTSMGLAIAETYARQPSFYGKTFCCQCGDYFPVGASGEFRWDGTTEHVGT